MLLLVGLVGLFLGGLLNVVVVRLPRERRLLGWPRCVRTGEPLRAWQLIPLVGWMLQRGKARDGQALPWLFPVVEAVTAAAVVTITWRYGAVMMAVYLTAAAATLIVSAAIDWLHRSVYSLITLLATLLVLVLGVAAGRHWLNLLLGAVGAGLFFLLLYVLARAIFPGRGVPFGMGDVYLAIFIGAVFGLTNMLPALSAGMLLAGLVAAGMLIRRRVTGGGATYMPYGTYMCLGALAMLVLGTLRH